jgi:hypothetical protein
MAESHRSWLREPLLQFLFVGALVFTAHRLWQRHAPEPQRIVVTPALRADLAQELKTELGREPNAGELAVALENWKSEEILYREGVRLGLDRDDPIVRRRMASKMLELQHDLIASRQPTSQELDQYLEQNLARYTEPPRYDFEHVFVGRSPGDALSRARALQKELAGGAPSEGKGDEFEAGRVLEARTSENLRQLFGENFARRLPELEVGRWNLVESVHGWHVVRLDRIAPAAPPERARLAPRLVRDWKLSQRMSSGSILQSELGQKYTFEEKSP